MKEFFKVTDLDTVLEWPAHFARVETENIPIDVSYNRVLAEDVVADINLPDFPRSIMDGYAVAAASTFGASEGNPAYLAVPYSIAMGEAPDFSIRRGEAAKISTGGMLPKGADSVVMVEHTDRIDDATIEVYRSVAPGQNLIEIGEDIQAGETILFKGWRLRAQEIGLLAALGIASVPVYRKPVVSIISSGDEVLPIQEAPALGKIRDINSYTLAGQVIESGGTPVRLGIVKDNTRALLEKCELSLEQSDMVLISGGSSVGKRDFTVEVISRLPQAEILAHGISISPGKPTILARVGEKPFWGLPGHVVSAMVVFNAVVRPFLEHISGIERSFRSARFCYARLSRNISSAQGRVDYVRVKLEERDNILVADPVLGKSGLIHTMVKADGLLKIDKNTEGLDKGSRVKVEFL
ncbi:MAG: molybdopterin molybdotransferase MoeA [Deltaproteobacteria bacterium]